MNAVPDSICELHFIKFATSGKMTWDSRCEKDLCIFQIILKAISRNQSDFSKTTLEFTHKNVSSGNDNKASKTTKWNGESL